jgi:hypothetical protein
MKLEGTYCCGGREKYAILTGIPEGKLSLRMNRRRKKNKDMVDFV